MGYYSTILPLAGAVRDSTERIDATRQTPTQWYGGEEKAPPLILATWARNGVVEDELQKGGAAVSLFEAAATILGTFVRMGIVRIGTALLTIVRQNCPPKLVSPYTSSGTGGAGDESRFLAIYFLPKSCTKYLGIKIIYNSTCNFPAPHAVAWLAANRTVPRLLVKRELLRSPSLPSGSTRDSDFDS